MLASIVRKVSVNSSWEVCGQNIRSTLPWGVLWSGAPAQPHGLDPCLPLSAASSATSACLTPACPPRLPMPQVQGMLRAAGRSDVSVEIVFPVSPEAITTDKQTGAAQVGNTATPSLPGSLGG